MKGVCASTSPPTQHDGAVPHGEGAGTRLRIRISRILEAWRYSGVPLASQMMQGGRRLRTAMKKANFHSIPLHGRRRLKLRASPTFVGAASWAQRYVSIQSLDQPSLTAPLSKNVYITRFTSPWSNTNKAFLRLHPQSPMADIDPQQANHPPGRFLPRSTARPQHNRHLSHNARSSLVRLGQSPFLRVLMYLYTIFFRFFPLPAVANSKDGGRMCYLRRLLGTMSCKAHCGIHNTST